MTTIASESIHNAVRNVRLQACAHVDVMVRSIATQWRDIEFVSSVPWSSQHYNNLLYFMFSSGEFAERFASFIICAKDRSSADLRW